MARNLERRHTFSLEMKNAATADFLPLHVFGLLSFGEEDHYLTLLSYYH